MKVYHSTYKDVAALTLESEQLKATFLPGIGSKMASLVHKTSGREYLWQEPTEKCSRPGYDTPFDAWDMYGFDEMFPTIAACHYEKQPWQGVRLPDHGEVWSLPWEYELEAEAIHFWVSGIRLPYRLDKWVCFSGPQLIHMEYRAINNTPFDQEFIWAAHPLFNIIPGTRILLPPPVKQVINVLGGSDRLGGYHQVHPWPTTVTPGGGEYQLDRIYPRSTRFEKYYALEELQEGWAALYQPQTREVIAVTFPVQQVPYLGVWVNEGGFANQYNAALEPCTGAFDRVDAAALQQKVGVLKARSEYRWHLNLTILELPDSDALKQVHFSEDGKLMPASTL